MADVQFEIPEPSRRFLADTIASASGHEVYFLGKIRWTEPALALLDEVEAFTRGNAVSTPAVIEGAEDWDVAIHNHPGGDLTPSDADVAIAGELSQRGVAFVIIDNRAERLNVVVRPLKAQRQEAVDEEEVRLIFRRGGPLSQAFSTARGGEPYEVRPGQIAMALAVTRALNRDGVVALEAGTGVGKSFAYLVPAILWATRNRRRVIISTNTINLQEQLIHKDLPFLEQHLPTRFEYTLIKGRGNYACLRKAAEVRGELATLLDSPDDARSLSQLLDWIQSTADGSLGDLSAPPREDIWEKVMSETDKSLKVNCRFYHRCFYYEAKRRANKADILVVNHHLFFADLAVRRETGNYQWNVILPGYDRVIFDEAHHLEDVASKHLGFRVSQDGLRSRFHRLVSPRDRGKGLLPFLARKLRQEGAVAAADAIENHYIPVLPEIDERIQSHFQAIATLLEAVDAGARRPASAALAAVASSSVAAASRSPRDIDGEDAGRLQVRLRSDEASGPFRRALLGRLAQIRKELEILGRVNDRAARAIKAAPIDEERGESLVLDLTAMASRLDRLLQAIRVFSDDEDSTQARWLELRPQRQAGKPRSVQLHASPVRVAEIFNDAIFTPLKTVVLGSATLAVSGQMEFVAERLGLDRVEAGRFQFLAFPSPFDFARQSRLLVPVDLPEPGQARHEGAIAEFILEVCRRLRGRTFVLFTSHGLMRRVHQRLDGELAALGVRALCQGEINRSEILRRFRSGPHNVLFGTDSFWEGVDVKGRDLECVIITRLPFRVPTEPLQIARIEEIEKRGKSSFPHFTVPQAVLKFKQGFGRLIRSAEDRGVVVVLDRRIVTKAYGRTFIESLPPAGVSSGATAAMLGELEAFFKVSSGG
jgi:ATP-dependent DNA helicase DinG